MRRLLILLGSALALGALLAWAFWPRPVVVELAQVAPRTIEVTVEEEGQARIREVFTVSAPISGQLHRISLHAGDAVEAEVSVVARISPAAPALLDARARAMAEAAAAAAQAAVDLARAAVAQAEAERDYARTEAERSQALFDRAALSRALLDSALLRQRTAEAAVQSARASLAVRERELDSARAVLAVGAAAASDTCCIDITAPVSGQILRVLSEDAQVVASGTPLLEIGNPGNLEVEVELLSRDATRVQPGAVAQISGWGGDPIAAQVARVEPAATTKVSALGIEEQRVKVVLSLTGDPSSWAALGHGFRVIAHIRVWQGENVLSLPVGALFRDGSGWATFVAEGGRARLTPISLGERNDDFVQVLGGVSAGQEVIVHPSDMIADGTRLTPLTGG